MINVHIQKLCSSRLGLVAISRLLSSSTPARSANIPAGFGKIKEKQRMFNLDNGLRVHQRGGMTDAILYNLTLLLILAGFCEYLHVLYRLVFPGA